MNDDDDNDEDELFEVMQRLQRATFDHTLPDGVLGGYVTVVNNGMLSFGITLAVDGMLVSGTLVSISDYMRQLSDVVEREAGTQGIAVTSGFRAIAAVADEDNALAALQPPLDRTPDDPPMTVLEALEAGPSSIWPVYLHLLDATIWQSGVRVASNVAWRGRLAMVSGWTMGTLGDSAQA